MMATFEDCMPRRARVKGGICSMLFHVLDRHVERVTHCKHSIVPCVPCVPYLSLEAMDFQGNGGRRRHGNGWGWGNLELLRKHVEHRTRGTASVARLWTSGQMQSAAASRHQRRRTNEGQRRHRLASGRPAASDGVGVRGDAGMSVRARLPNRRGGNDV